MIKINLSYIISTQLKNIAEVYKINVPKGRLFYSYPCDPRVRENLLDCIIFDKPHSPIIHISQIIPLFSWGY